MIVRNSFASASAFALAWATALFAQPAAAGRASLPEPELEQMVAEAIRSNPDLTGAIASAEAARLRVAPARTLPDPSVSFNYQNDGKRLIAGPARHDVSRGDVLAAAPLARQAPSRRRGSPQPRRRGSKRTVGRARLGRRGPCAARLLRLSARAGNSSSSIEDRGRSWREISDIVRERYAVGLGVQQDVLRAQIEVLRLDEARAEQRAQVVNRRAEVNRVLGRPQETDDRAPAASDVPRGTSPDLPAPPPGVRDRSPELAGVERAIEAARLRAALAKKNFLPDFVASGGPMYRGGLDPMWQVGLGVSLPIFAGSRQRPLLAAAEADVRIEEARALLRTRRSWSSGPANASRTSPRP